MDNTTATATAKRFNKGDAVTLIESWDNKGTFIFQHWTVYASGKQQITLVGPDGFAKRRVLAHDDRLVARFATDAETVAHGIAMAAEFLAGEKRSWDAVIDRAYAQGEGNSESTDRLRRGRANDIAAFHAPECVSRETAEARI